MSPSALHPVMTCAEARGFEHGFFQGADSGLTVREAMSRAASGVARETRALLAEGALRPDFVVVLCGTGRNAGDALLAAHELLGPGAQCRVCLSSPRETLCAEAAWALARLESLVGVRVHVGQDFPATPAGVPCLVLDGLTGSGFRPPLSPAMSALILAANSCEDAVRVAVDLPSGAGDASDSLLFSAHLTVATGVVKAPLVAQPAVRAAAGRIRYADIGFFDRLAPASRIAVPSPQAMRTLGGLRPATSDKRDYGHVAVLGGSRRMPGALMLNVLGALRSGAGLVTAFCPESVHAAFAAAAPEAMWVPLPESADGSLSQDALPIALERLSRADALVCGSGLGASEGALALVTDLLAQTALPVVVDADALRPEVLAGVKARPAGSGPVVLTPHAGEFLRICGRDAGDGFGVLNEYAREARAIVVHKGPGTRVADGERGVFIPHGGPALARGGSGDLLAGMVGAALAAKPGAGLAEVAQSVALHGAAADAVASRRGALPLRTTDLLDGIGEFLRG